MELPNENREGQDISSSDPLLLASLIGKLRIMDREINRHSARTVKLIGITTTELVFLQLVCMAPGSRLSDIASKMDIHQATSSNIKRSLLQSELIETASTTTDGRVTILRPTQNGKNLAAKAAAAIRTPLRTAGEALSRDQLMQLNKLLALVTDKIDEIYESGEHDEQDNPVR